jgi:uncharacterized Zn finger protein
VTGSGNTVNELVEKFNLRRRASTRAFTIGVRLARRHAVRIHTSTPYLVKADVDDGPLVRVELVADDNRLLGHCTCGEAPEPCAHQVAVAHTLWVRDRLRR